ncbi:MAG TPA: RQC domain-containing protein, partial [Isosphaeraceae bacterium]|nr:RQC domain-containing protein [Isosphaeraceae bacterium]
CDDVGAHLARELRKPVAIYHAGLGREERAEAQDRFMSGRAEVVVATNAFGMGVDKPDIRSVIHFNMPGTLEAYYQEAGRAGRDGQHAECVLLYAAGDRFLQEMFIENEYPPPEAVYRVYDFLRGLDADPIEMTQTEIKEATGLDLNESAVGTAIKILEGAGGLERFHPRENMAIVRLNLEPEEAGLADRLPAQAHNQKLVMAALEGLVNRRYGEPVYFVPDELATSLGLERSALTRALKNLSADLPVDYVPPFRGNALRITDRTKRPRDLVIDFKSLNQRKQQEYGKLDQMTGYARASQCRRSYILKYFGDTHASRCGRCDNCGARTGPVMEDTRPLDTPAAREVVLKALSGVARAKGRFGKTTVAMMLTGSSSEKMDRGGLRNLSTFGILSDFTQSEVNQILDALISARLVDSEDVDRFRPILTLTERGWSIVRGQNSDPIELPLPEPLATKVRLGGLQRISTSAPTSGSEPPAQPLEPEDDPEPAGEPNPLREHLRTLRNQWAREAGLPAFRILYNETIEAIVLTRPRTPAELARIKGLGPSKLEKYGDLLLEAVRAAADGPIGVSPDAVKETAPALPEFSARPGRASGAEKPSSPLLEEGGSDLDDSPSGRPSASKAAGSNGTIRHDARIDNSPALANPGGAESGPYVPTEEWTWRLFDRGFRLTEVVAIRGLERSAVIRHATWMARKGRLIALDVLLEPETRSCWESWVQENGDTPPPVSGDDERGLWSLFLMCRQQSEKTISEP